MNKRLPLVFRHVMYNLRGGFLVRPLIIALVLGFAGASCSWMEETWPAVSAWVPIGLFPSHSDPQVAQVILSGIATSIMTVVSIVFAILLMTLTLASMQFSPRIIVSFSKDRVTQQTLGIFLGTFCYCMAALPAARSQPFPFSPVVTVFGAMVLAVACVGWLLFFIHHISHAISVNYIVDRIASETEAVIDEIMPTSLKPDRPAPLTAAAPIDPAVPRPAEMVILNRTSGYIRVADQDRLFQLAKVYRVTVQVLRRVGHFVPAGIPLLRVWPADRIPADSHAEFLSAFDIGPSRTLQQDIEFGVLQIVDIALRAISPAVNDPSTAINCIDQLSRILIRFGSRELPRSIYYDLPGVVRLRMPWIDFDGLLDSAFEQIRQYGSADIAVCLRLLRALGDISSTTPDAHYRQSCASRGQRIVAGCTRAPTEEEKASMQARLAFLEQVTVPA